MKFCISVALLAFAAAITTTGAASPARIAYESNEHGSWDIFVINEDGTDKTRLTIDDTANEMQPAFSRDGKRVAFVSDIDGDTDIYVMNADGTGLTQLTDDPARDEFPAFSPEGESIVFQSDRDSGCACDFSLYTMNSFTGQTVSQLTSDGDGRSEEQPEYFPDGSAIAFMTNGPTGLHIYKLDLATNSENEAHRQRTMGGMGPNRLTRWFARRVPGGRRTGS